MFPASLIHILPKPRNHLSTCFISFLFISYFISHILYLSVELGEMGGDGGRWALRVGGAREGDGL